jgi:hypothetical protein
MLADAVNLLQHVGLDEPGERPIYVDEFRLPALLDKARRRCRYRPMATPAPSDAVFTLGAVRRQHRT